jgi:pimeloyl-ACP methyl ester carboxylesterase
MCTDVSNLNTALTTKMLPKLPYKILVPELDPTAPMILAESAKRFMPAGSTYDIEVVKNCGHWVLIQYPELASQSILNWLEQKVLPGQASLLEKIRSKL